MWEWEMVLDVVRWMRGRWMAPVFFGLWALAGGAAVACRPQPRAGATMADTSAAMTAVAGTVTYRQDAALPNGARVTVSVEDVSLQDAPPRLVGEQVIVTRGQQVPLRYEIKIPTAELAPRARYRVSARIDVDDQLAYIATASYPVITYGNPLIRDVVVSPIP
jgi:uncharacterized lipoprotein YbaY